MSMRILSITVLLLLVCSVSFQHNGRFPSRRSHPCCPQVSNANVADKVTSYRELSARPGCVWAVLLTTKDKKVCVDPKEEWVQKLIANMTKV